MTADELSATRAYCERKRQKLLARIDNPNKPPQWVTDEIRFVDSMENLAVMHYRLTVAFRSTREQYDRLVALFETVENAFFAFVRFRHRFTNYKRKIGESGIHTMLLLKLFSMLPETDEQNRTVLIEMINEHITEGNPNSSGITGNGPTNNTAGHTQSIRL